MHFGVLFKRWYSREPTLLVGPGQLNIVGCSNGVHGYASVIWYPDKIRKGEMLLGV